MAEVGAADEVCLWCCGLIDSSIRHGDEERNSEGIQEEIWIAHAELAQAPGRPFYERLNEVLESAGFEEFVEARSARFYHARLGRPSLLRGDTSAPARC